jgi:hypothetical protein
MCSYIEPIWEKEVQEKQARKEEVQTMPLYSLRSYSFPTSDLRAGTMPVSTSHLPMRWQIVSI